MNKKYIINEEDNVRVYELAKDLGISSMELMNKMEDMGYTVNSHMSNLEDDVVLIVKEAYSSTGGETEDISEKSEVANGEVIEQVIEKKETVSDKTTGEIKTETDKPKVQEEVKKEQVPELEQEKVEESSQDIIEEDSEDISKEELPDESIDEKKKIKIAFPITTKEFAEKMEVPSTEIIKKLMDEGVFASINQTIDKSAVISILGEYGYELEEGKTGDSFLEYLNTKYKYEDKPEDLKNRPPIVTLMGHVDHGKTLLLDTIRKTNVVDKEVGGITQHIGAYEVEIPKGKIVFQDTPGHEAFTSMRARGASLTDIAVLVVAADEGIKPQTLEALDHAKAAAVPVVVALNKIDKQTANPEKVKRELVQHGLIAEDLGGETVCCEVSAMTGVGIKEFLEMLLLQAEIMELTANPNRPAWGTVVETRLTSHRGPVASVIVKNGTLKVGDPVLCGMFWGKVKAMLDDKGNRKIEAAPSTPIEITGLDGIPDAGSDFYVVESEREAKEISSRWKLKMREKKLEVRQRMSLDDLYKNIEQGLKELKIVLKADTHGSVEALRLALEKLSTEEVSVRIIHAGVGDISETDINLAIASNAIVIGFHVKMPIGLKDLSKKGGVEVRLYNIIYQAVSDIRDAMEGLLEPEIREEILGVAKVLKVFKLSKAGAVAGCMVEDGKIVRNAHARIKRDGEAIYVNQITSLKRFKDEVKEVAKGYECGIRVGKFEEYNPSDIIEVYRLQKKDRKL